MNMISKRHNKNKHKKNHSDNKVPRLDVNGVPSVTSIGNVYRPQYKGVKGKEGLVKQYNAWIQDSKNERLRWDQGKPGEIEYLTMLLFRDHGYFITTKDGFPNSTSCAKVNVNYMEIASVYAYPYDQYFATGNWKGHGVDMFGGISPDQSTNSTIPAVLFTDVKDHCFRGWIALTESGYFTFYYPHCKVGPPDESHYKIPDYCSK